MSEPRTALRRLWGRRNRFTEREWIEEVDRIADAIEAKAAAPLTVEALAEAIRRLTDENDPETDDLYWDVDMGAWYWPHSDPRSLAAAILAALEDAE